MSPREIQRAHHVGWRTARDALDSAWPKPRAAYPRRASRLDAFRPVIDEMLVADLDAPRKQRHTATRIFDRLLREPDATGISYGMVRDYVATRRPEIRLGQAPRPSSAPSARQASGPPTRPRSRPPTRICGSCRSSSAAPRT